MLFKRKGGNKKQKDQQARRSHQDEVRQGTGVPKKPVADQNGGDWDSKTKEEMSSIFNRSKKDAPNGGDLEGTRRAVAQRRASKKMASIDWDVAARDEITALFGFKDDNDSPPAGADNDLESVRRAIAERKAQSEQAPPELDRPERTSPAERIDNELADEFNFDDEDERGPRLDWLVDFISDDDRAAAQKPADDRQNNKGYVRSEELKSVDAPPPEETPFVSNNGVGPSDIELVPRSQENVDDGISIGPEAIMGDGFGNIPVNGGANQSSATGNDVPNAFFDEVVKEVDDKPAPRAVPPQPPRQEPVAPNPPAVSNNLPAKRQTQELEAQARSLDLDALRTKDRVVGILLKKQIVTMTQVYEAQKVKERESSKETLWRILVAMESVDSDSVFEEAARIYAFPIADTKDKLDAKFVRSVMETLSEENRDRLLNLHLVPFECETEQQSGTVKLVFITHDPMRTEVRRVMKELKLDRFDLYYAPKSAVESVIVEAFPRKNEFMERILDDPMAFDLGMSYEETEIIDEDALEAEISRSSLINLFEATLVEAVRQGASDVHIYPNAKKRVEIHFRIDGRLSLWHTEHKVHPEALLAVIKDNAMNVDRFERDAAQDGYIQRWIDDVLIRFRVSVLPIANVSHEIRSESIVIRVLDDRKVIRDLRKLGLLESAMETFETAISQPHGMVILTGPTGSGKSTTLVAALHHVINGEVNVLTVEDPVEYIIPGVRQIKLNFKLELENALRAILRHDPDIVMVGEMRDRKTAELAIKLANTGHLTFSTLHTNDAPSAVSRLYKMGIEPFLLAYAINLIVAQRLIRKLCLTCRQQDLDPDPVMLDKLGFTAEEIANITFYEPGSDSSCPTCKGVGYKGRRAICEALFFSREIRHMIVEADRMIDEGAIKEQAVKEGMLTLRDSAREIVKLGETSVREMIRVVTAEG